MAVQPRAPGGRALSAGLLVPKMSPQGSPLAQQTCHRPSGSGSHFGPAREVTLVEGRAGHADGPPHCGAGPEPEASAGARLRGLRRAGEVSPCSLPAARRAPSEASAPGLTRTAG